MSDAVTRPDLADIEPSHDEPRAAGADGIAISPARRTAAPRQAELRAISGVRRRAILGFGLVLVVALMIPMLATTSGQLVERWQLVAISIADLSFVAVAAWWLFLRAGAMAELGREAMLARSVENSPHGRVVVNASGRAVYANQAYRNLVHAAPDGPVPALEQLFEPGSPERQRIAAIADAAERGTPIKEDLVLHRGQDEERWLTVTARTLSDNDDRMAWYIQDATPQHATGDALRAAESKLTEFVEAAPVGYCFADGDGRIQYVNRTMAEWIGGEPGQIAQRGIALKDLLIWEEGGDGPTATIGGVLREGAAQLRRRDGSELAVRVREHVMRNNGGEPVRTALAISDVSREGALDAALQKAAREFRQIFDQAPVGVVILNQDGIVTQSNQAFKAMSETADGGVGGRWTDLLQNEDRSDVSEFLTRALDGVGNLSPLEIRLSGSRERVAQLFATRLQDASGDNNLLLHLIDSTEQKDLELRFFQSQKMQAVGQLAGGVAHDFNNLLTAMIGFCDLLLLHHPAGDPSFSDIMHIKQNANRAANLVRQLLAFSRQQTLRPKVLVVTDVLAELSNLLHRLIGENIELNIVHGRDMVPVKVDQGQFEQVIINLAVNARDAMDEGGTLTIRTANVTTEESMLLGHDLMPPGEYALIQVVDTGRGIPKENIGKIYEPFFTTKEVGAGTGLGLSTVYGIIKQTGGNIWVESHVGKGTTFSIYLPRHIPAEGELVGGDGQENQAAQDLTGKGTVLLVEDEDAVRMFAARALQNKGYTVLQADSGDSALETIRGHDGKIELMISDVVMPNMDGPTLVQHARVERPDMRIIFISGYAEDAFRKTMAGEAKEIEFLPKPFSLKQLASKVKDVLAA